MHFVRVTGKLATCGFVGPAELPLFKPFNCSLESHTVLTTKKMSMSNVYDFLAESSKPRFVSDPDSTLYVVLYRKCRKDKMNLQNRMSSSSSPFRASAHVDTTK